MPVVPIDKSRSFPMDLGSSDGSVLDDESRVTPERNVSWDLGVRITQGFGSSNEEQNRTDDFHQ